ncbi:MAG: putative peptide zinc metalloprotease protein [Miltoncostaeaceae bacterium]|nr:putative peptide zinc metalloprotease protein [Miltoncostaeaceae bacterium]
MRCPECRRRAPRGAAACGACGLLLAGRRGSEAELVGADGTRRRVGRRVTIGRGKRSAVRLADPTVARRHARLVARRGAVWLVDAGSPGGTRLGGRRLDRPRRLREGDRLGVGGLELRLERPDDAAGPARTIVGMPAVGAAPPAEPAGGLGPQPRLRPGWALKRLEAREGALRFVLADPDGGPGLRMGAREASLLDLLDGRHGPDAMVAEAERRLGRDGAPALAVLVAGLADHGLLEGVAGAELTASPAGWRRRLADLARPREVELPGAGPAAERLHRAGGWVLLTAPALSLAALVAVVGALAMAAVLAGGGAPLRVAGSVGFGALAFLLGRVALVAAHEAAHALVLVELGRAPRRAGLKAVLGIPFAFVDTSAAWFEPRRRRMAVAAAGPAADLVLAGAAALAALALPGGTPRQVALQLAFAGYAGALLNLNPLLDRDGYHLLADALRQPGLRTRSRARLRDALAGRPVAAGDAGAPVAYALCVLAGTLAMPAVVVLLWGPELRALAERHLDHPGAALGAGLAVLVGLALIPLVATAAAPLAQRRRAARTGDARA